MRKFGMRSLIIGAALALGLGGCATNEDFGKIVGTISGAGLGSLVGGGSGKTVMTVVGGVAGYMVGGQLGRHMDQSDHDRAGRHLRRSFETPGTGTYNDTWSGRNGAHINSRVTTHPYHRNNNRWTNCQSFVEETTIHVQGRPEVGRRNGVACFESSPQYPDGLWVIQQ